MLHTPESFVEKADVTVRNVESGGIMKWVYGTLSSRYLRSLTPQVGSPVGCQQAKSLHLSFVSYWAF